MISDALIDAWPYCDGGFEEWYFFATLPGNLHLSAYCNWTGLSVADWPKLVDVTGGIDLLGQLDVARPTAVLGIGERVFAISTDPTLIDDFRRTVGKV